ncbi:MAG: DMT family transporter [Lachnospiraceae bacterium]|nr:DMT family transporter [Lachnospiraceae bacterium]
MRDFNWKNPAMLLLAAFIWGSAFVAQSVGMDYVEPFTFNCVRSIVGGLVLIPCIYLLGKLKSPEERTRAAQMDRKTLLAGGVSCGVILCLASNAQQIGIQYTSVGKAGFITALYIVIVPILGIFLKRRCGWKVWVSVLIALIGFYLLCMVGGFSLERGDVWLLMCAVLFSFHILIIDHFSPMVDGVKMSCIQFFTSGLLSGIAMLVTENPDIANILAAWVPILYAGVLSSGVAYTLQIVGQKNYNPTVATLLLSLESVFSVLTGWVVLHQKLSVRELCGCVLIFIAVILAQLPEREKKGSVECMKPET